MLSQKQNVSHESLLARHAFCMRLLVQQPALSAGSSGSLPAWHGNAAGRGLTRRGAWKPRLLRQHPGAGAVFPCLIGLIRI